MKDRRSYFEKAGSWAEETRAREARVARAAWVVAGIAIAIALLEAVALAMLVPLKTVQPVTMLVDRQTGFVQALDPAHPPKLTADAALTQAFLAQYVAARESFDRATVARDYRRVALWSAGPARAQYLSLMPATNPQSPLQRFRSGLILSARVKSVSKLSEGVALVRFDTQVENRSGRSTAAQPWVAVLRYRYDDAPMTFENRLMNPLGFQVTSYRRDPEAPAVVMPESPAEESVRTTAIPAAPTTWSAPARAPAASYVRPMAYRVIAPDRLPMGSPFGPPRPAAIGREEPR